MARRITSDFFGRKTYSYYNDFKGKLEASYVGGRRTFYRGDSSAMGILVILIMIFLIAAGLLYLVVPFFIFRWISKKTISFLSVRHSNVGKHKKSLIHALTIGMYFFYLVILILNYG